MNAEILAVGSELLSYQRIDTNSLYLTERLNSLGVEVPQKGVVGDDLQRLTQAVRQAVERSEIVLLTGGLGPTEDDLTREAVAQALGRELVYHEPIYQAIQERFAKFRRTVPDINKRQAWLVEGAVMLPNPNGTAPGQWIEDGGRLVVLLPGPPGEMKPMVSDHVYPRLRERLPEMHIRTLWLRVAGMGESELDQLIAPVYKQYENPVTTILAKAGDLEVHLRARCATADEAERLVEEVGAKIQSLVGLRIYSRNGDPMEVAVGALLRERGATLAVAESCTGGLLGARVTDAPGSSDYFLGGFQVYGKAMKVRLLGIDAALVDKFGVVSEEVARAMADSARDRTRATYALSITGEAGPVSSNPAVEVGTVWIGLAGPEHVEAKVFRFPGGRERVRGFAVQTALNLLRMELIR
jgi:nicotinamide-nucleotide amidase